MDPSSLQHRLTDAEREQFEHDGYFIVEDALQPDLNRHLADAVDRLQADGRLASAGHQLGVHGRVHHPDFLCLDKVFLDLVDHPRTFPKVWDILGWNIYVYHTHLGVSEPLGGSVESDGATLRWHQDSFPSSRDMPEVEIPARLSLKIGYFLTDVSEPGRGNFWVVPGSHTRKALDLPPNEKGQPDGAIPLCSGPGSAVYFDRRLWHAASPNSWHSPRKFLAYGYGYRWLRTKDQMTIPPDMFEHADPIRRQLLGFTTSENNRFGPSDQDVPLKLWLEEHAPQLAPASRDGPPDPN
jgi:ectoine hydroxylase-related dioxygenase (phytanoyl-CoA dioxygenase family)